MQVSFHEPSQQADRLSQLDRYLPQKIRFQIEQNYYAKVNEQAQLDQVARNEEFLGNPLNHVALYSDHGVVHVRDVATNIVSILETINGVLIPARTPLRLEFMKGYGVMLAYNHDIGMRDFSAFGRAMHPEFAAQEVFSQAFDPIIETIWAENCGNVAWRLVNLAEQGVLKQDPRLVLREMLALSVGHSKSKVPIDSLNDQAHLRQVMLKTVSTNLQHLYHEQQVNRAAQRLARTVHPEADEATQSGSLHHITLIQTANGDRKKTVEVLQQAQARQRAFLEAEGVPPHGFEGVQAYYANIKPEAFCWLTSNYLQLDELVSDITDTIRALRVADALRQRGTVLKTSAGYQIFVDQNTGNAVFALQKGSGEIFLLESSNPLSAGEANVGSGELTRSGDLRLSFHRGAFATREIAQCSARYAATVIDDIQRDIVDTFRRPVSAGLKSNQDIQILIEETDDNLEFADLILEELKAINPELGRRSRIAPSLKLIFPEERDRYLAAEELNWPRSQRERILLRVAQSGHKTRNLNPDKTFTDVRLTTLKEGETLITAGAPPGFVYIPMGEGLLSTPLGGYQAHAVKPWIPLGNTRVIRGDVQEATVTAEKELKLLMIPKETYLKYWHDTYTMEELPELLRRVYVEDELKGLEQTLEILHQVALIDQQLSEAELVFIQKFTESYGLFYSVHQLREKLLNGGGKADFITLRQSVLDYLRVEPPHLQAARLKDLINVLVKVDETISEEEQLILAELNGLFVGYLDEEAQLSPYKVWLVPQSSQQDEAIASLLPDLKKLETSGGFAYLIGAYYSKDYAEMIGNKYRMLHFFTTIDHEETVVI
jgi:hypothetical protein